MDFKDRLKYLIDNEVVGGKKATPYQIGKNTSVSRQSIENYLIGKQRPSIDNATIIAGYFGVSANWLLTGEGEMLKPFSPRTGGSGIQTSYIGTFTKPIVTDIKGGNTVIGNGNITGASNTMSGDSVSPSPQKKTGKSGETSIHDLDRSLFKAQMKLEFLQEENERLKVLLSQAIADKDKAMAMLEKALGKY